MRGLEENVTDSELREMIERSNRAIIDFSDFFVMLARKKASERDSASEDEIRQAFNVVKSTETDISLVRSFSTSLQNLVSFYST